MSYPMLTVVCNSETYKKGQTETSGGRWGVAVSHAVRPDTERQIGKLTSNKRGTAFCGADVYVFNTGPKFNPADDYACKRCSKAVSA